MDGIVCHQGNHTLPFADAGAVVATATEWAEWIPSGPGCEQCHEYTRVVGRDVQSGPRGRL
jgi:hypothetical protein